MFDVRRFPILFIDVSSTPFTLSLMDHSPGFLKLVQEAQPRVHEITIEQAKQMLAALAAVQRKLLQQSEHVGARFADEARAIHLRESAARSIHGRATRAQTESLLDEGIAVAPLPFPVIEPGQEN